MANCSTDPHILKVLFKEKKELFGLVYQFNLLPAVYIHKTWLDDLIPYPIFLKLTQSKRGMERTSQWILEQYDLICDFHYNFEDPLLRLALLPPQITAQFILYCGIALNYTAVTTVIDKKKKHDITESIGSAGYEFAVKSAPLLMGKNTAFLDMTSQQDDLKTFFERCGAAYMLSSFANAPCALFNRLRLKFPKDIDRHQELFYLNQTVKQRWWFLKRILFYVIESQWTHLFS